MKPFYDEDGITIWCSDCCDRLDNFAAGSVLLAARQLGRRAIGIEISEEYCERAVERLGQTELALEPAA